MQISILSITDAPIKHAKYVKLQASGYSKKGQLDWYADGQLQVPDCKPDTHTFVAIRSRLPVKITCKDNYSNEESLVLKIEKIFA